MNSSIVSFHPNLISITYYSHARQLSNRSSIVLHLCTTFIYSGYKFIRDGKERIHENNKHNLQGGIQNTFEVSPHDQ
jgi:hypothetical protein